MEDACMLAPVAGITSLVVQPAALVFVFPNFRVCLLLVNEEISMGMSVFQLKTEDRKNRIQTLDPTNLDSYSFY